MASPQSRAASRCRIPRSKEGRVRAELQGHPIDQQGANLFFQLISRRYERGPMLL
jgi:hypothetical protein